MKASFRTGQLCVFVQAECSKLAWAVNIIAFSVEKYNILAGRTWSVEKIRILTASSAGKEVYMKIWIWGTGKVANDLFETGLGEEIQGFIETHKSKDMFKGYPVIEAADIPEKFDYILVATYYSNQIYDWCVKASMDMGKIIFIKQIKKINYFNDVAVLKAILGERNFTDYQIEYGMSAGTYVEDDAKRYQEMNTRKNFEIKEEHMWPIIGDKYANAGTIDEYFWQDLWGARHIISDGVKEHYDIGSRLDGFIAHLLAAGIDVHMIDVRPFPGKVDHLHTVVADATMMDNIADDSLDSLSALCSLEHFGLGRYGDPVDPEACFKCFGQIQKKLKRGGKLYLSVTVGSERVEFNAHRVFYASTIVDCFDKMELKEYSCVAEGEIEYHVDIHKYDDDKHNGAYRFGLFYFVKK